MYMVIDIHENAMVFTTRSNRLKASIHAGFSLPDYPKSGL